MLMANNKKRGRFPKAYTNLDFLNSSDARSLRMLAEYMHERAHAPVALLAIQPDDTSAGESLSPAVAETFRDLMEHLPEVCRKA